MTAGPPARPAADDAHLASRFAADVAFARSIAEEAGRILSERYERVERIDFKSAKDVVTEVDHLSEELILGAIRRTFPGDGILAEESGAHQGSGTQAHVEAGDGLPSGGDGRAAAAASRALTSGRTWIVDPVDGTINYANGIPYFCVSVGLVVDGRPAAGAVHDPMRGETFSAVADGGAWLAGSGGRRDPRLGEGDADRLGRPPARSAAGRSRPGRGPCARRSGCRGRWARRRSRSPTSRTAGSTRSSSRAGCPPGTWRRPGSSRSAPARSSPTGGPWFDVDKATRAFGLVAAPPSHHAEVLRLTGEPAKA